MNDTPELAHQYLRSLLLPQARALSPMMVGAAILPAFVLRNGIPFAGRALPDKYKPRPPKQCYFNARSMALRSKGLTYHEGFAAGHDIPFVFNHAWVVDTKGQILDPTLSERAADYSYLGVPIPTLWLTEDKRYSGQFMNKYEMINTATLFALDPGFKDVLEKLKEGQCPAIDNT